MGTGGLIFYVLFTPYGRLTVLQKGRSYYWLELRVRLRYRGRGFSEQIIKCGLSLFQGCHHVHFNPKLSCALRSAKRFGWRRLGESDLFEQADHYVAKSLPYFEPEFACRIVGRNACPELPAYRKGQARIVVSRLINARKAD